MIQTSRNLKNVGKRPKCPECGAKDPVSHGLLAWTCGKCGRSWNKFIRRVKKKNTPNCKKCSAGKDWVVSWGEAWKCKKCGRRWQKVSLSKRLDLGERPDCPECGTDDPHSIGPCWRCRKCGKAWIKDGRREYKLTMLDLHKVPVHEI